MFIVWIAIDCSPVSPPL